jgi:hypothetical protein
MWSSTIYQQHANRAAAVAFFNSIGIELADGEDSVDSSNFVVIAPISTPWINEPVYGEPNPATGEPTLVNPGSREPGFWTMMLLNEQWAQYESVMTTINASGTVRPYREGFQVFAS